MDRIFFRWLFLAVLAVGFVTYVAVVSAQIAVGGIGQALVSVVQSDGTPVNSFGGGTQYTEGDTDTTITGTAVLLEAASNTLATWLTNVLGDNTANPTVPGVASFNMCFDGSTWDRCPTSAGGTGSADANTTRVVQAQTTEYSSIDLDESEEEADDNAGELCGIWVSNRAATELFLKIYDADADDVTVGTTAVGMELTIPADSTGSLPVTNGCYLYSNALSLAATTDIGNDGSPGAPAANDVQIVVFLR